MFGVGAAAMAVVAFVLSALLQLAGEGQLGALLLYVGLASLSLAVLDIANRRSG